MRYKLYLDELPAAVVVRDPITDHFKTEYSEGIPVGKLIIDSSGKNKYILYNHFNFLVKTQPIAKSSKIRIVGFEIEPRYYH